MAFNDDDLKRLKAEADDVHPTRCRPWITGEDLHALLARLEAAEEGIETLRWIAQTLHTKWRKAAGKDIQDNQEPHTVLPGSVDK